MVKTENDTKIKKIPGLLLKKLVKVRSIEFLPNVIKLLNAFVHSKNSQPRINRCQNKPQR